MKKLFEEIKQDKLKFATVCVAFVVFAVSIVIAMVNVNDTYAISNSDGYVCPLDGGAAVYGEIHNGVTGYYCSLKNVLVSTSSYGVGDDVSSDEDCKLYLKEAGYTKITTDAGYYCSYEAVKEGTPIPDTSITKTMYSSDGGYVPCFETTSTGATMSGSYNGCTKIEVNPTNFNNWYYNSAKNCYIEQSTVSESSHSSCSTPDTSNPIYMYSSNVSSVPCYTQANKSSGVKKNLNGCATIKVVPANGWYYSVTYSCYIESSYLSSSLSSSCSTGGGSEEPVTTYTVSYNANGGDNAPSSQTKTKGTDLTLSSDVPTRDGFEFVNWNTEKDGTGTSYGKGGKYIADSDVTLYAQWKENSKVDEDLPSGSPSTGDALIYIAWAIGLGALGYSVYYFIKKKSYL